MEVWTNEEKRKNLGLKSLVKIRSVTAEIMLICTIAGPLVRPNGSLDRHGKVEKSGPDRSFIRKKSRIRAISDLTKLKY